MKERGLETLRFLDKKNSIIYLVGDVDDEMYSNLMTGLTALEASSEITIVLNTEGGDFYQGLAIYDAIKFFASGGVEVKIVCSGPVMSAGAVILQAATKRVAFDNSYIMIHYGVDSNSSSTDAAHNRELLRLMQNIIAERVSVKKRTVNSWFKGDTYFNTARALEVGLIDRLATSNEK